MEGRAQSPEQKLSHTWLGLFSHHSWTQVPACVAWLSSQPHKAAPPILPVVTPSAASPASAPLITLPPPTARHHVLCLRPAQLLGSTEPCGQVGATRMLWQGSLHMAVGAIVALRGWRGAGATCQPQVLRQPCPLGCPQQPT